VPATRIKFCGLTRAEDIHIAVVLEVDAIGLNLARGPRKLTVAQAAALARLVPPHIAVVALFADQDADAIDAALAQVRVQAVQLHGDEPPELAERLRARHPVIKAFGVHSAADLDRVRGYPCDAALLDAPGGGTGTAWDHGLLRGAALGVPLWLAGGLRPTTVRAAIAAVQPALVDVSSGIEAGTPGVKDRALMTAFVAAVRG
jgi:phosphoribosylanthranilate isomerase